MKTYRVGILSLLAALLLGLSLGASPAELPVKDDVMVQTYRQALAVNAQDVLAQFNLGLALYKLKPARF